jgi:hypothetical protein
VPFAAFSTDPTVVQVARQRAVSASSTFRANSDSTSPEIQPINSRIASGPSFESGPVPPRHREDEDLPLTRLDPGTNETATHEPTVVKAPTHISQKSSTTEDVLLSNVLLSRSLARYQTHLRGMHAQLQYHIASVKEQISAVRSSQIAKASHLEDRFEGQGPGGWSGVNKEEMRRIELRMRIERLKKVGWKRERFDGERYRTLCKEVIAEIN